MKKGRRKNTINHEDMGARAHLPILMMMMPIDIATDIIVIIRNTRKERVFIKSIRDLDLAVAVVRIYMEPMRAALVEDMVTVTVIIGIIIATIDTTIVTIGMITHPVIMSERLKNIQIYFPLSLVQFILPDVTYTIFLMKL